MENDLLIKGRWIVTGAGDNDPLIEDGALFVSNGVIADLGDGESLAARYPGVRVVGSDEVAVIPGLINAHHHSSGATALQHGLPDMLLEPWILAHARMRPRDIALDVLVSAGRLLRSGVTSVVEVLSGGGTAESYADRVRRGLEAYEKTGMRVAFAAGISEQSHIVHGPGKDREMIAQLPADLAAVAESWLPGEGDLDREDYFSIMAENWSHYRDHARVDVWYGPPGPQWVSDPFMAEIAEHAAARETGIQTHVNESLYEKLYGPLFYGKSTLAHLKDLGVLSARFSIAHGVWLSEEEVAILAETGAAISHNPSSNLRLRAGIAPLNAIISAGATTALGMDGTTLNDDEDMFTEMRLALRLNRGPLVGDPAPCPRDVLGMATLGGAKLLGKENTLGRLTKGYQADLVLLDLDRITRPWIAPECDPRDLLVMRARAGDVKMVLVAGEVVLQDGKPTRFDPLEAGRELGERLSREAFPDDAAKAVEAMMPRLEAYYGAWDLPELDPYSRYNARR
jgi:cytosine/adenosine deaminase-related metal-dependent hydrolase